MASGVSYVPARISDRHHNCRDLNQALHILGFGSWNELWPESERHNLEYVPMKINESLSEQMSKLEENDGPNKANRNYKESSSNVKVTNSKKKVNIRNKKGNQKDSLKGSNSIEKKREIHEAYQVVLNEYHRRLDLRRKSLDQTNAFRRRSIQPGDLKTHVDDSSAAEDDSETQYGNEEFDIFDMKSTTKVVQEIEERKKISKAKDELNKTLKQSLKK